MDRPSDATHRPSDGADRPSPPAAGAGGAPPRLRPMLAGGSTVPGDASGWLVEPKWDGIRAIVTVHTGRVTISSRNDNDVTAAYPELATPPPALESRSVVLDGEIIAIGSSGHPEFGLLQRRMHVRHPAAALVREVPVNLVLFDLLWDQGELIVDRAQRERRRMLDDLGISAAPWMTSPVLDLAPGEELLATCRELGIEGFVLKRQDAPYLPGRRSDAWIKIKCGHRREFVVGGWMPGQGGRSGEVGSLGLGVREFAGGPLRFIGLAGSGLSGADVSAFRTAIERLGRDESPFATPTPNGLRFLEPVLVAEVSFTEVTRAGTLRHPVLAGFRTDLDPAEVVVDGELRAAGYGAADAK